MKTKEEVIKQAYGIDWEKLSEENKELALHNYGAIPAYLISRTSESSPFYELVNNGFARPSSLHSIEDNNGWIKIESDDDLPKDNGYYMPCEKGLPREDYVMNSESLYKGWLCGVITHYRPREKQKPPIY